MSGSEISTERFDAILAKFAELRVGVVGDYIADVYIHGTPTRLSREAPVIIRLWDINGAVLAASAVDDGSFNFSSDDLADLSAGFATITVTREHGYERSLGAEVGDTQISTRVEVWGYLTLL